MPTWFRFHHSQRSLLERSRELCGGHSFCVPSFTSDLKKERTPARFPPRRGQIMQAQNKATPSLFPLGNSGAQFTIKHDDRNKQATHARKSYVSRLVSPRLQRARTGLFGFPPVNKVLRYKENEGCRTHQEPPRRRKA